MDSKFSGAPRLPKSHYSTYRQYKENERKILHWVHGTVSDIRGRASASTPPISTTHRPRAQRSRARNTGPRRTHPTVDPDFTSAKIPLRLFIQLVQEIADSDVVIPLSYLHLVRLSIKQRKLIAAYYSPDADVSQTNKSHIFAIRAYTQAFDILRDAEEKRTKKDVTGYLRESPEVEDDIFALSEAINEVSATLDAESVDTSAPVGSTANEWIRDNPMLNSSSRSIATHKKPATFPLEEYELVADDFIETKVKKSNTQSEAFDALECFLVDLYGMRKYCNEVWKSVAPVGNTSHIAASFVTNKAVQLVKEMEYALIADFPVLNDMDKGYDYLLKIIAVGLTSDANANQQALDLLIDQTMYHTWDSLQKFGTLLDTSPSPVLSDGYFGYFDPLADREKMGSRERYLEDRCIMGNHWPDLIVANKSVLNMMKGDSRPTFKTLGSQGLLQDFKGFTDSNPRHVSWALIFACQMQADSVLARRRYLNYDLSVMRNLGRMINQEYLDFINDGVLYSDSMDKKARPFINRSATEIYNSIELDRVTAVKLKQGWDKLSKQATQKDAFWLQNSWLTANVISEVSLDFFFAGISVWGAGGYVQSTIQLWNMLRQTGYLPPRASSAMVGTGTFAPKDQVLLFDHLIDVCGDQVFSGPPPKSDFLKSWEIMMGVRPEAFARGKRQLKKGSDFTRPHNDSGRGVEPTISDLFNMHHAKYLGNYKAITASTPNKPGDKIRQKHPLAETLDLANSELGQSATLPSQEAFEPRGPLLNINYFKVHRLCVNLITELEPVLRPDVERYIDSPLDHNQVNWPYLTGWIAMTETKAGNGGRPDRIMLQKAAEVVKKHAGDKELGAFLIREEGDESLILR